MSRPSSTTIIAADLMVQGRMTNCRELDVFGRIDGSVSTERLRIHPGGRVYGTVSCGDAEIEGTLQGDVTVKNLISIGTNGNVSGNVRYGRIAMAAGGELSAEMRNVPPEISGDFSILVRRGRSVRVTTADLTAIDPDDTAATLVYTVSNARAGYVALASSPAAPTESFTQASLESGSIYFVHDGSSGADASFDIVVTDKTGARSSGPPQTIKAVVIDNG